MTTTSDKILLTPTTRLKEVATGKLWTLRLSESDTNEYLIMGPDGFDAMSAFITHAALLAEIAVGTYKIVDDAGVHPITSAIESAKRMRHNLDNIINDLETIAVLGHHATKNSFYVSDNAKLVASNLNTRICDWHDEVDEDNLVIAEYIEVTSKL